MEEKKKDLQKEKLAEEFVKTLGNLEKMDEVEKMIKDNTISFSIGDKKYKVRKLTFEENGLLEKHRRTKYVEFINDDSMLFQKQWIEKYKSKGIDIDAMEDKIRENIAKENQIMIELAQTAEETTVMGYKEQIIELRKESALLNIERTDLLAFSIEDQLMVEVNSYYTYLALEESIENVWANVYDCYEEFSKSQNNELTTKAFQYTNALIYHDGF